MTKIEITKQIVGLATGYAVSTVITGIIRNNFPVESKADEALVRVAGYVITGMVSEIARKHTDKQVDKVVELYQTAKNHAKKAA